MAFAPGEPMVMIGGWIRIHPPTITLRAKLIMVFSKADISINGNLRAPFCGYTENVCYSRQLLALLLDSFRRCETDSINLVPQSYKISLAWGGLHDLFLL